MEIKGKRANDLRGNRSFPLASHMILVGDTVTFAFAVCIAFDGIIKSK